MLDGTDLVHVHFGYEHRSPAQIAEFVGALRERGTPLVVTVHDLTNPHEADPAEHLERTGHLVQGADAVITLTPGAAEEIRLRWGVDAHVIPHPRLMPTDVTEPHRRARLVGPHDQRIPAGEKAPRTVGLVLGSLRAGVAAEELLSPVVAALPPGMQLVVMVRSDALAAARKPDHPRHAAALDIDRLTEKYRSADRLEVRVHEHLSDLDLCAALAGFDALVLPHRHGTHSGWLELCRDMGIPPLIPRVGHLVEQWGEPEPGTYAPSAPDPGELSGALLHALDAPPPAPRAVAAEDGAVAQAHAELYRAVLTGRCPANAEPKADATQSPLRRTISAIHSGA